MRGQDNRCDIMNGPGIHFLVPYVGSVDYLKECVASVRAQSDPRWLLTVVEDGDQGSGVRPWLDTIRDPRLSYVLNPDPLGLAANFQHCLNLARCDHFVLMGSDDVLLPTYVSVVGRLVRAHPDVAAVQPGVEVIDSTGRITRTLVDGTKKMLSPKSTCTLSGETALRSIMRGNWTYFPSICWRTEVVRREGFRADLPTTLDLWLLARLILGGEKLLVQPEPTTFRYRRHRGSASSAAARELVRFTEEERMFTAVAVAARGQGWNRAAQAASRHVTSRLHALAMLPASLRRRDLEGVRRLTRHALARVASEPVGQGR